MFIFDPADQLLASLTEASALLKVISFFFVWTILWLPLAIPLAAIFKWRPPQPLTAEQKLPLLASLYWIAPLIVWGASRVEVVSFSSYGLVWETSMGVSLIVGLCLGVLGLAGVFSIQRVMGWISWRWEAESNFAHPKKQLGSFASILGSILLPTLLLGLWVSGTEELIFRGFLLNELRLDYPVGVAAVISSLIFALLHLVWEQQETFPQLPGLWLMGMILVLARVCDGNHLGLAWGLHAGWIWGIASMDTLGLITYTGNVPEWVTGFSAKPLAGAAGIVCLLGTGMILWLLYLL